MLKGIVSSLIASSLFGYLYYFSTLLQPLTGEAIFGYRIVLTYPFLLIAIFLFKQKAIFIQHLHNIRQQPKLLGIYVITSSLIGFQMWLFLWAPNHGSALSVSFGYLLLPLVLVATGHFLFAEPISKIKLFAILFAGIGVISNILLKGGLSWESIVVSVGYTTYFCLRKHYNIADLSSFCIEMLLLLPICGYFIYQSDYVTLYQANPDLIYLLPLLGLISGLALITYILASAWLPMNLLGLLGYVETILMIVVAFMLGESLDAKSYPLLIGLSLAMLLIMLDGVYRLKGGKK